MTRIQPLPYESASPEMKAAFDRQIAAHGRMTNMKRTLAHSPAALDALMTWYPLFDETKKFLGERAAVIYVHAISSATDCLICSTFFRRILVEWGENPDELKLSERERLLIDYGCQLVVDPNNVSDALYARLAKEFSPEQIVTLTAWGAMMIATNVFNNALRVPLDDYLGPYRKEEAGVKT
jgi:alkylhydroperoxidase family enzyme